jgi:hypothetical protein
VGSNRNTVSVASAAVRKFQNGIGDIIWESCGIWLRAASAPSAAAGNPGMGHGNQCTVLSIESCHSSLAHANTAAFTNTQPYSKPHPQNPPLLVMSL